MQNTELTINSLSKFQETEFDQAFIDLNNVVLKEYLENIDTLPVYIESQPIEEVLKSIRLNSIVKIVYDKSEDNLQKMNNVFASLSSHNTSVFIVLHGTKEKTHIYMGTQSLEEFEAHTAVNLLENSLEGNFQGITTKPLFNNALEELTKEISSPEVQFISSISGIPALKKTDEENFIQGIEKIIEGMNNHEYITLLVANPIDRKELNSIEEAYQNIYSSLSLLETEQISLSKNETETLGTAIGTSISQAISHTVTTSKSIARGENTTKTEGTSSSIAHSKSTGTNESSTSSTSRGLNVSKGFTQTIGNSINENVSKTVGITQNKTETENQGNNIFKSIIGRKSKTFSNATTTNESENYSQTSGKTKSEAITNTLSESVTFGTTNTTGKTYSSGTTKTYGNSQSIAIGTSSTETDSHSKSNGTTDTTSSNETSSQSTAIQKGISSQRTIKDKKVIDYLSIIDEQLKRIRECKNSGMWEFGVYFLGKKLSTTSIGADLIHGLLCGETSGVERSAVLHWNMNKDKESFNNVREALVRFRHPKFDTSSVLPSPFMSATSLISTKELAIGMSLPQKSIAGIPVFESVEFGRAVSIFDNQEKEETINLGVIQHLGKDSKNLFVNLNINSLTAHTFITGSTGAGKSNFIYSILHNLWKEQNIPFLIIEPAKGEYKEIFGGYENVNVFGTNYKKTNILKINPFSFPEDIHITEHIDKLIEILNAVWAMYSAMPAFLKKAIEMTYENLGWDLVTSENKYSRVFPDFTDLLEILPSLIESSDYSAEVKGNYIGALVTRIESLTNGYFRSIFTKDELDYKELFDKSCILDFSRVGSSETKALLMGIIFMKLHEYRLSTAHGTNAGLKHITVIEEAHNLLRKTSTEQSAEGSNLQGKSVEMISNAIAEMRTYGEGFIIADQAPALLDTSVIRNTNTKIILRLPDWNDRELVGRAANLKDEQIEELARLRTGCAAVYQNNWQEAVLCQAEKFAEDKANALEYKENENPLKDIRKTCRTDLLKILFCMKNERKSLKEAEDYLEIENIYLLQQYFPKILYSISDENRTRDSISSSIKELLEFEEIEKKAYSACSSKSVLYFKQIMQECIRQLEYDYEDVEFSKNIISYLIEFTPTIKQVSIEKFINLENFLNCLTEIK